MNIDKILSRIAIEEAPENLVQKWRTRLQERRQRERARIPAIWIYIAFPVIGVLFLVYYLRGELLKYYLADRLPWLIDRMLFSIRSSMYQVNLPLILIVTAGVIAIGSTVIFFLTDRHSLIPAHTGI